MPGLDLSVAERDVIWQPDPNIIKYMAPIVAPLYGVKPVPVSDTQKMFSRIIDETFSIVSHYDKAVTDVSEANGRHCGNCLARAGVFGSITFELGLESYVAYNGSHAWNVVVIDEDTWSLDVSDSKIYHNQDLLEHSNPTYAMDITKALSIYKEVYTSSQGPAIGKYIWSNPNHAELKWADIKTSVREERPEDASDRNYLEVAVQMPHALKTIAAMALRQKGLSRQLIESIRPGLSSFLPNFRYNPNHEQ